MAAETIADTIKDIRNKFPNMDSLNEQEVKKFVIERILKDLNWNLFDPKEFKPEYRVGNGRADYALNPDLPSIAVFIEVKKPSVNLENAKHPGQLLRYCFDRTVNLGVLTNGRIWWLYLPRYEGPQEEGLKWTEKRFCEIDITNGGPTKIQKEFNTFLAKERVSSGEAVEAGKVIIDEREAIAKAQREIVEKWNTALTAPSDGMIKLVIDSVNSMKDVKPNKRQGLVKELFQNHRGQFKVSDFGYSPPGPATKDKADQPDGNPSSFTFLDGKHSVEDWTQVLVKLCKLIYAEKRDDFDQIMSVRGNNLYFSKNPDHLDKPEPIGDSGIFAATGRMGASRVKQRCRKVLREFRYNEDCFRID